ncbi:MAG: glycosyltransferase family 4 protein [Tannerella sp.]|jgi:glycosyltransferase involved in cell wall biosynthesis|nr:glycosyltransferase family 4 protein [Tannerella sp.]
MNIVFDCERMKHPYTGLFEYCVQLGKALQTCTAPDDQIIYYVPERYERYFGNGAGYRIHSAVHRVFPVTVKCADIVHGNPAFIKTAGKAKRIITIHDLNFLYEKTSPAKINKYLKIFQHNADKADAVITISEYAKNDILNHLTTGNKPVFVIHNGCNVSEYPDYDAPGYRPATPFLFSVGTVLPKKNFHVLPCLLAHTGYELIIAGKGNSDYADKIIDEAKKYNVADRVKLLGAVNDKDKYWYLKHCEAFLFPSLAEGFGIPPVEAMHFGKPVFLSTKTSLPEIGGKYAYYFDDFAPENMRAVFEAGMNHYAQTNPIPLITGHAGRFNWERSAAAYLNVYKSVLQL